MRPVPAPASDACGGPSHPPCPHSRPHTRAHARPLGPLVYVRPQGRSERRLRRALLALPTTPTCTPPGRQPLVRAGPEGRCPGHHPGHRPGRACGRRRWPATRAQAPGPPPPRPLRWGPRAVASATGPASATGHRIPARSATRPAAGARGEMGSCRSPVPLVAGPGSSLPVRWAVFVVCWQQGRAAWRC